MPHALGAMRTPQMVLNTFHMMPGGTNPKSIRARGGHAETVSDDSGRAAFKQAVFMSLTFKLHRLGTAAASAARTDVMSAFAV